MDTTNLAESLRYIAELKDEGLDKRVVTVDGEEYLVVDGEPVAIEHLVKLSSEISEETVNLSTLQGIVDFFGAEIWEPADDLFIRVVGHELVWVESKARRLTGVLPLAAKASFSAQQQRFGEWLAIDDFMTWLLTRFVRTDDLKILQDLLGRGAKIEAVRQVSDDGVSSQLKRSRCAKLEWTGNVQPHFALAPRRTFPEIDQPESLCTLRFKNNTDDEPILMRLIESDGGGWKVKAMASIAEFLADKLEDVPILR